jgi:hypothetical protein
LVLAMGMCRQQLQKAILKVTPLQPSVSATSHVLLTDPRPPQDVVCLHGGAGAFRPRLRALRWVACRSHRGLHAWTP